MFETFRCNESVGTIEDCHFHNALIKVTLLILFTLKTKTCWVLNENEKVCTELICALDSFRSKCECIVTVIQYVLEFQSLFVFLCFGVAGYFCVSFTSLLFVLHSLLLSSLLSFHLRGTVCLCLNCYCC